MSKVDIDPEDVSKMTDEELIRNILGECSIVGNNSSRYIDEYANNLRLLLIEKHNRKLTMFKEIIHGPNYRCI